MPFEDFPCGLRIYDFATPEELAELDAVADDAVRVLNIQARDTDPTKYPPAVAGSRRTRAS